MVSRPPRPFKLDDDGDLIGLIRKMLCSRGEGTVCISKVKGHAEEELVRRGQVRELHRDGNKRTDEAADFARRRVCPDVIDARRNLSGVCERWCQLLGISIAFSLPSPVLLLMLMILLA